MSNTYVELDRWEILQAGTVGLYRQWENVIDQRKVPPAMDVEHKWQNHIEGALAECALAKFLGVYWKGVGSPNAPDVGEVDARVTQKDFHKLILHPWDPNHRPVFLLVGKEGKYHVRGWMFAGDGKVERYWQDPVGGRPAFFVPQRDLRDPHDHSWRQMAAA